MHTENRSIENTKQNKKRRIWKYETPMANECLLLNKLTLPIGKENKCNLI